MIKRIRTNEKGFTLIELMIVVAIIGILAAIAIPNFLQYQLKSKTTEAKTNLGAIKTSQMAFKAEWDGFIPCGLTLAAPSDVKQPFVANTTDVGFETIGFEASGNVYYSYEVAVGDNTANTGSAIAGIAGTGLNGHTGAFCASALGDLDADGANGEFGLTSDTNVATTGQVAGTVSQIMVVEDLAPGDY
jgi:type IV pilus assembly protein PilA